jgi:hypothetical protein
MPLAQSQWHQLFSGFLRPGFFCFSKRCQGQFQGVCEDLNLLLPRFSSGSPTSALFERKKARNTLFLNRTFSQSFGRRLIGLAGPLDRRPFSF